MVKKKILFVIPGLEFGGTNKALENLLAEMDFHDYDVSIFCIDRNLKGPYYAIFQNKLIGDRSWTYNLLGYPRHLSGLTKYVIASIKIAKRILRFFGTNLDEYLCGLVAKKLSALNFEVVVAFQEGLVTMLCDKVQASKKIAWVHCDYSRICQSFKNRYYFSFDKIVCVSEYTKKIFCGIIPEVESKTCAIHNVIDTHEIIVQSERKADIDILIDKNTFNIVSVGRIASVKRFTEIPRIAAELYYGRKLSFTWYIVGNYNTDDGEELWENIRKYRVEHVVRPIGARKNPYAYMASCNLYVCLSVSEACPFVINEASILHLPIVCTDFPSAHEFIKPGFNGVICPFESLAVNITSLIFNKKKYDELCENIKSYTYNNELIKKKLKNLFEF